MRKMDRGRIYLLLAWLILAAVIWIALSLGAVRVSPEKLFHILFQTNENMEAEKLIILKIRLPRIILAALTGISLTLGGTVFQALFKNPMAEPYILGISSGSALGASLMALTGINISLLGISALGLGAFGGAGLSLLMLYFFILSSGRNNHISLLLGGVVLSFFFSSLLSLILSMDRELAASILFWTMGSFTTAGWEKNNFSYPPAINWRNYYPEKHQCSQFVNSR
jgi:iron complex transport system permease protein